MTDTDPFANVSKPEKSCRIEGCGRKASSAFGACPAHASRWYRHGTFDEGRPIAPSLSRRPAEQLDCQCADPRPDQIGECRRCRKLWISPEYAAKLAWVGR